MLVRVARLAVRFVDGRPGTGDVRLDEVHMNAFMSENVDESSLFSAVADRIDDVHESFHALCES